MNIIEKELYEKELLKRQKAHLENVSKQKTIYWQLCAHDQCTQCYGTGIKHDGSYCTHNLYCSCPKCASMCQY